jgi:hypothetical protein
MNDVLRFIALAAALGLAAGLVLGGMALVLSAPAYAGETEAAEAAVGLSCLPVVRRASPPPRLEI